MNTKEMLLWRMRSQGIAEGRWRTMESLVGGMGCIQAQDFGQAKWAIGVRVAVTGVEGMRGAAAPDGTVTRGPAGVTEADVDAAFNEGRLLRTHVLRPTWHFVLPADIGWMLRLTGPKVKTFCLPYHRKLGIDVGVLKRSKKIMIRAMEGGKQLTRTELAALFRAAKIDTGDIRMNFLLMDAELDGLICSGGRRRKQFCYALLEERAPRQTDLDGEAALAELTRRYFVSRGPATAADLAWWGGMTLGQARRGLEIVGAELERVTVGGEAYWWDGGAALKEVKGVAGGREVLLLPAFDEYAVAYKDRGEIVPPAYVKKSSYGL
ncbi:MAG TPA: winged helix DNA-binding domain-containing protein, partial [Puia sp.]|nr:winged helix DNA-binding domain-containing protein [Puia sp.]